MRAMDIHLRKARARFARGAVAVCVVASTLAAVAIATPAAARVASHSATTTTNITDLASQTLVDNTAGAGGSAAIAPKGDITHNDGSLELKTGSDASGHPQVTLINEALAAPLSSFSTGSYDLYNASGATATYQLPASCDGSTDPAHPTNFVTFYYVPGDNGTVTPNTWQTWDTVNGGNAKWEASRWIAADGTTSTTDPGNAVVNPGVPYTLTDMKNACKNKATVSGPKLNLGSGEPNADNYVDNVQFNDTVDNFKFAGSATISTTLPTLLDPPPLQADPATFDGHLTNNGPDIPAAVVTFTIRFAPQDGTLTASTLHVEYEAAPNVWQAIQLTESSGTIVGTFGPPTGFPVPNGYNATTHFRMYVDPHVNGKLLGIATTLNAIPGNAVLAESDSFNGLSGPSDDCPAFPGNDATVRLAYGRYLGRCADPVGRQGWDQILNNGAPITTLSNGFSFSPENDQVYVTDAYNALLGRAPDPNGLAFWSQALGAGMRVDTFLASLANSQEFSLHWPNTSDKINVLYNAILGRDADPNALSVWGAMLTNGQLTPGQLATTLWRSPEGLHLMVTDIYEALLDRGTDPAGLNLWSNILLFTGSPFYVEGQIGGSQEFVLQAQTFPPILLQPQAQQHAKLKHLG